ncbi:hypothetical protein ACOME3_005546 [Neoechinorhynchus agilis]
MHSLSRQKLANLENILLQWTKSFVKPRQSLTKCSGDLPLYVDKAITELAAGTDSRQLMKDSLVIFEQLKRCQRLVTPKNGDKSTPLAIQKLFRSKRVEKIDQADTLRIKYSRYSALGYLYVTAIQKFSALCHLFNEMKIRDHNFKPMNIVDCSSGVGSSLWSFRQIWPNVKFECYTLHEPDRELLKLSKEIERYYREDGKVWLTLDSEHNELDRVHHKIFFPSLVEPCDIVVSGYGLPTRRLYLRKLVARLIKLVKPNGYLIFVEPGTTDGFRILHTIRQIFTQFYIGKDRKLKSQIDAHIFAPCGQDESCPYRRNSESPIDAGFCYFNGSYPVPHLDGICYRANARMKFDYAYLTYKMSAREEEPLPRVIRNKVGSRNHCFLCCPISKTKSKLCHLRCPMSFE